VTCCGHLLVLEIHACGTTPDGHSVMRVWRVRGESPCNGATGWMLIQLDSVTSYRLLEEASNAPRPTYYRGDPTMQPVMDQV
jgi:hypothetical protein